MKIQYQLFPDYKLLIQKYSGDWSNARYFDFIGFSTNIEFLNETTKILTDLRDVVNWDEIYSSFDKLREVRSKLPMIAYQNVMLVDKPLPTALTHAYQQDVGDSIEYSYCSTLNQALRNLRIEHLLSVSELQGIIENLEHKF